MDIDIHIIINMNIKDYKRCYLLFVRYSLLGIPYWVFLSGWTGSATAAYSIEETSLWWTWQHACPLRRAHLCLDQCKDDQGIVNRSYRVTNIDQILPNIDKY